VRGAGVRTPILLLTARDTSSDRVQGLNAGADDYLNQTLRLWANYSRVSMLFSVAGVAAGQRTALWRLAFARDATCAVKDEMVKLTATEGAILELLMRRSPLVVSREAIAISLATDLSHCRVEHY